jgi:hypothetical protein
LDTFWVLRQSGASFTEGTHRDEDQRFIVRADEKLTAFVEFESAIGATNNGGSSSRLQNGTKSTEKLQVF